MRNAFLRVVGGQETARRLVPHGLGGGGGGDGVDEMGALIKEPFCSMPCRRDTGSETSHGIQIDAVTSGEVRLVGALGSIKLLLGDKFPRQKNLNFSIFRSLSLESPQNSSRDYVQ